MTRVSTLAQNTLVTSYSLATKTRMAETQVQVASGMKSQRYSGIALDTSRLLNLEGQRDSASSYIASIKTVQTRVKLMTQGLSSLDEVASNIKSLVNNTRNTQAAFDVAIWSQADNALKQVQEVLNLQDDSGYLFAGARRDQAPVDTSYATINGAAPFPATPVGGPPPLTPAAPLSQAQIDQISAAYYSGATTGADLSVRTSDGTTPIDYGLKGNEEAFKNLIAGLHMIRQANSRYPNPATSSADVDQAYLDNGMELITKAISGEATANYPAVVEGLRSLAGNLAATNGTLGRSLEQHTSFVAYTEVAIADIEQVDTAEAVVRLNSDQIALQAAFSTLAQLQEITLLNYLR
jgi:flagellar hook-associated protein 3 FlgL